MLDEEEDHWDPCCIETSRDDFPVLSCTRIDWGHGNDPQRPRQGTE